MQKVTFKYFSIGSTKSSYFHWVWMENISIFMMKITFSYFNVLTLIIMTFNHCLDFFLHLPWCSECKNWDFMITMWFAKVLKLIYPYHHNPIRNACLILRPQFRKSPLLLELIPLTTIKDAQKVGEELKWRGGAPKEIKCKYKLYIRDILTIISSDQRFNIETLRGNRFRLRPAFCSFHTRLEPSPLPIIFLWARNETIQRISLEHQVTTISQTKCQQK